MKSFLLCALALTTLWNSNSFAQEDVIIIDRGALKGRSYHKEPRLVDNISVIKFSPLQMLAGEINFGYERQVSKKGSIEIELGPTISDIGFGNVGHTGNWSTPSETRSGSLGFFTSFGYRYYPLEKTEALNRFYVSPILRFKMLNYKYEDQSGTLFGQRGNDVRFDFLFNFGYQLWAAETFSLDFFAGMGIGMQQVKSYYVNSVWSGNDWTYQWVESSGSGARYVFSGGVKIGIGQKAK